MYVEALRKKCRKSDIRYAVVIFLIAAVFAAAAVLSFMYEGRIVLTIRGHHNGLPVSNMVVAIVFGVFTALFIYLGTKFALSAVKGESFEKEMENLRAFGDPERVLAYIKAMPASENAKKKNVFIDSRLIVNEQSDHYEIFSTNDVVMGSVVQLARDKYAVRLVASSGRKMDLEVKSASKFQGEKMGQALLMEVKAVCPYMRY